MTRENYFVYTGLVIDIHSHILPRVDDGCRDLNESLRMADMYLQQGVEEVVATPHVGAFIKEDGERIVEAFEELKEALWERGMPLVLHLGGEVRCAKSRKLSEEEASRYSLGWSDWILLETRDPFSPSPGVKAAKKSAALLQEKGHSVLLAHPERSLPSLQEAREFCELGVCLQITADSLCGAYGKKTQALGRDIVANGLASIVATDGHSPDHRPPRLSLAMKEAGLDHLVSYLCEDMPRWILYGGEEPEKPESWTGL